MPLLVERQFVNIVRRQDMPAIEGGSPAVSPDVVRIHRSIAAIVLIVGQVLGPGIGHVDLRSPAESMLKQTLQTVVV